MPWMPVPRDICGLSYTLLPAPVPPARFSAHFDPNSPFFQTEVVIRVVAPVEGEPVPMEMMSLLDPGDIGAWLRRFGDPSPLVEHVEFGRSEPVPGTRGRLRCFCQMRTHLDVGPDNPQSGVPDWVRVPTRREPGRRHWSEVVDGYAEQLRRVFSYMWYEGPFLVCCAVASTRYEDRRGCSVDTLARYPWLLRGQEEIAASVRVIDRGLGLRVP
jgi:hypothetical protein